MNEIVITLIKIYIFMHLSQANSWVENLLLNRCSNKTIIKYSLKMHDDILINLHKFSQHKL